MPLTMMQRKTLARLRLARMEMRREGKLVLQGAPVTDAANTDVAKTWMRYDYVPPSTVRDARD